jgi:ADP-ribose pyrophosphatase
MNRIIAGTILENDGKILLVKENRNRDKGKWWIPAGGVDEGELIEEGAIRETFEESGFNVKISGILCIYNKVLGGVDPVIGIIYKGQIIDGELRFDSEEIAEAKWFSYDEIISIKDKLRNPLPILKCIEMLKKGNVLPLDTILKI